MTSRFHGFRTGWIVLSALSALVFVASCRRIPLYDPQSGVYLKLDIRLAIDVDLSADIQVDGHPALENKVYGKTPEMVRVAFAGGYLDLRGEVCRRCREYPDGRCVHHGTGSLEISLGRALSGAGMRDLFPKRD